MSKSKRIKNQIADELIKQGVNEIYAYLIADSDNPEETKKFLLG